MLTATVRRTLSQQIDRLVLYSLNRRVPDSLQAVDAAEPSFEQVLSETQVDGRKTAVYSLLAPGEHIVWLNSLYGPMRCHVRVRLAANPKAPLVLYHHGLAEIPYTSTWQRIFPKDLPFSAHTVVVQAPYHNSIIEPLQTGFASLGRLYTMLSGSLRIMQMLHQTFEAGGAAFTVAGGLSWGGITSILYGSLFNSARAIAPLYASPNVAQVIWDAARMFGRPVSVPRERLNELLDFTALYRRMDPARVFPVLGEDDLFFRLEAHEEVFSAAGFKTLPTGHVGGTWARRDEIRQHFEQTLDWAAQHPL